MSVFFVQEKWNQWRSPEAPPYGEDGLIIDLGSYSGCVLLLGLLVRFKSGALGQCPGDGKETAREDSFIEFLWLGQRSTLHRIKALLLPSSFIEGANLLL